MADRPNKTMWCWYWHTAVLPVVCLALPAPYLVPTARAADSQKPAPVEPSESSDQGPAKPRANKPPLRVVVDPRVDLMSIIFRLAGNPEYNKGQVESYTKDAEEHFGPFRDHPVVELARGLRAARGVSYDAVMSMAVHVTDPYTLGEKVPFDPRPEGLDARWALEDAREFLERARRFVKETSFRQFVEKHQDLYTTAQSRMQAVLDEHGHLEWFTEFFGQRPGASFTVTFGLLNGGNCYGARCFTPDGKEELFSIMGVWKTDREGLPQFDRGILDTVVHEFCHSYTNRIVDRHQAELKSAGQKIFAHVEAAMQRQAYGQWKTMMYESLVRACTVRYTRKYGGPPAAWTAVQYQKARHFAWVGELADLLGEYEAHRDKYPTLETFAPKIVAFFDEYANKFAKEQASLDAKRPKVVSMTPANGATDVDPGLAAITVVFDRPMQGGSWSMVGGGPHFLELAGTPSYDSAGKVWTVPVKLKPGWSYQFMLNSDRFTAFRSRDGVPLEPVTVTFTTRKNEPESR